MRRLLAVGVLPILIAITPAAQDIPPGVDLPDEDLPESWEGGTSRLRFTIACGARPPLTIRGWWQEADAIVRVRIDSQYAYDHYWDGPADPDILTDLEVTVLDVFKLHPRGVGAGASMTITHPGGTIGRADGPETHTTNGFSPPANDTEWFLFLDWWEDSQQFRVSYLEHGAFRVVNGLLVPQSLSWFSLWWDGAEAEAFAEALRRTGSRSSSS